MAPRSLSLTTALLISSASAASLASCTDESAPPTANRSNVPALADAESDAAPTDAASASTPDASGDAGFDASVDPCVGRTICDSFETGAVGAAPPLPWKVLENSGTVRVSDKRAFRGRQSLVLTTTTNTYQRAMVRAEGAPLFPLAVNVVYGRVMVWLEDAAAYNVHWNMISASGPVPGRTNVAASYNYGGQRDTFLANYDTRNAATDCWKHSKRGMPIGRWVCFAWRFDGRTNEMQLASDDGDIADMHVTNKGEGCLGHDLGDVWIAPTFDAASVGWESVQQDAGHTMYIDDLILDDAPLTCDR